MVKIIKAHFVKHPCYATRKRKSITPVGVFVHSTGAVNTELRRYVDAPEEVGQNLYNNHWNKPTATKSVHAFIGRDKNRAVIVAETLPHDVACWGAGGGSKGSYNYNPHAYLQFEICQGSATDAEYYWQAIGVAEEYCAHLCRLYGWSADQITSHKEAHAAGYASNHGDPQSYMRHFDDDMNKFRARVAMHLNGAETPAGAPAHKDGQESTQPAGTATAGKIDANTSSTGKGNVYAMKTIRQGSKGTQVKVLQWLLTNAGHDCGTIDGICGTKTVAAIKAYQQANGLAVDGIAGRKTWAALLG